MPESDDEDLEDGTDDDPEIDEAESVSPSSRKRRRETADGPQKRPRTDEDVCYSLYSTHSFLIHDYLFRNSLPRSLWRSGIYPINGLTSITLLVLHMVRVQPPCSTG